MEISQYDRCQQKLVTCLYCHYFNIYASLDAVSRLHVVDSTITRYTSRHNTASITTCLICWRFVERHKKFWQFCRFIVICQGPSIKDVRTKSQKRPPYPQNVRTDTASTPSCPCGYTIIFKKPKFFCNKKNRTSASEDPPSTV